MAPTTNNRMWSKLHVNNQTSDHRTARKNSLDHSHRPGHSLTWSKWTGCESCARASESRAWRSLIIDTAILAPVALALFSGQSVCSPSLSLSLSYLLELVFLFLFLLSHSALNLSTLQPPAVHRASLLCAYFRLRRIGIERKVHFHDSRSGERIFCSWGRIFGSCAWWLPFAETGISGSFFVTRSNVCTSSWFTFVYSWTLRVIKQKPRQDLSTLIWIEANG